MKVQILNPNDLIEDLVSLNMPFRLTSTTFTKKIDLLDGDVFTYNEKSGLRNIELSLIRDVKAYCEQLNKRVNVKREQISYIKVNDFNNGIYKRNLYEIDLNAAYWNLAYKYGYISKKIFMKGMNLDINGNPIKPRLNKYGNICNHVSKVCRLIALGNLAKTFNEFYFDGKEYQKPNRVNSVKTENYFFKVSHETDAIMKMLSIIAGDNYMFYWVDAIFVNSYEAVERIADYLTNEIGMTFKIVKLNKLVKTDFYIKVWDEAHEEPRPYIYKPIPKNKLSEVINVNSDRDNYINEFLKQK